MRFPTDLRVQNRQIAGQKYSRLPNAKAKIDRRHAFNTIKSTGQKIWFPARRCRCPDLRPAGPFGVPPYRFAAFDPARRAPFGMPAGAAARAAPVPGSCPRSSNTPHKAPGRRTGAHAIFGRPVACRTGLSAGFGPAAPFGMRGLTIPWRASGCARAAGQPAGPKKTRRPAGAGSAASAGWRGRADPARARKACRRVPVPGRRPQRVTRRGLRLSLSGRTPPAQGRRARRSPCCTRGRPPALRRVRPCRGRPPGRRTRRRFPPAQPS